MRRSPATHVHKAPALSVDIRTGSGINQNNSHSIHYSLVYLRVDISEDVKSDNGINDKIRF